MAISFGWSLGDIFIAIKFLTKVTKALQEGANSRKHHSEACKFLNILHYTLHRITRHVSGTDPMSNNVEMQLLLSVVQAEFESFRIDLNRKYPSLVEPQGWMTNKWTARWWTKEHMNAKVLELKKAINETLIAINTTLLLDSVKIISVSKELQENFVRQNTDVLVDVYKRIECIEVSVYRNIATKKIALEGIDHEIDCLRAVASQNRHSLSALNGEGAQDTLSQFTKAKVEANLAMITAVDCMLDAKLEWFYDYLEIESNNNLSKTDLQDLIELKQRIRNFQSQLADIADDASVWLGTIGSMLRTVRNLHGNDWSSWMPSSGQSSSGYASPTADTKMLIHTTPKLLNTYNEAFDPIRVNGTLIHHYCSNLPLETAR